MEVKLKDKIAEIFPGCGFADCFMFFRPVGSVLTGFCFEKIRGGIFISKYVYLMFNRSDRLNLNLGQRLPFHEGYLDSGCPNIAERIASVTAPHLNFLMAMQTVDKLLAFIEENPLVLRNEWNIKTYILALAYEGRYLEALRNIKEIKGKGYEGIRPQIAADCAVIEDLILHNSLAIKPQLYKWAEEMRYNLSIT